jgi:hypothetical protein
MARLGVSVFAIFVLALLPGPVGAASPKPSPTPPAPGIYLEPGRDGAGGALEKLETSSMSRAGTKDLKKGIATTMLTGGLIGGGPKMAYLYAGGHAQRHVPPGAWFQFHFDPKAASAPAAPAMPTDQASMMAMMQQQMETQADVAESAMPAGARQPQDFALVRLGGKGEERELVVGMDMKPKNTLPFRVRQLGPGAFRVAPEKPLPPGEYAFYAVPKQNGSGGSDKLWDFGVDPH